VAAADDDPGDEGDEADGEDDLAEAGELPEDGATPIPPEVPVVVLPPAGEPRDRRPAPSSVEVMTELQTDPARPYRLPPRDFLDKDDDDPEADAEREELLDKAKVLETALRDFGVRGKVTQVEPGPVITRYEIEPAPGQKVAPIANLSDDLALALRARSIRVVAPIPGKAAVGIEIPNPKPRVVRLGSLLETPEYSEDPSLLNIALGRTISGEPYCVALDRLPHLLVAGSTGSGKSVCINTLITSIICRAGPQDVRFVMVDPKMLELTTYVGLPHLIPPVVSQPKDTVKILKWAVQEMETRYRTLAHVGVRSIADHNRRLEEEGAPKLPYLVVIIDELADLMLSNVRSEIEESIARLAQMARAVGIHLVVATQRPSVDVITGVIKANFPSRVAFQVPTRTDSRTILDSMGAEKLLGRGDMLYLGVGMSEPVRVHGSYISTEETNDIVEWLKTRNPSAEPEEDEGGPLDGGNELFPMDREDDLFEEAARILVAHQQGSISLIQRRLKVGYARAARLVDMMEEAGIVGPFTGSKAREILIPTVEELEKKLAQNRHTPLGGKAPA
jgi:S-DNA-T family DNA segregation ATPase FtsK/SpoIIIE